MTSDAGWVLLLGVMPFASVVVVMLLRGYHVNLRVFRPDALLNRKRKKLGRTEDDG